MGHEGNLPQARELLNGTLPNDLPQNLMPETLRILHTIAQRALPTSSGTSAVTEEDFIQTFQYTKESTSLSPSGHHTGHYKAALKAPVLVQLHRNMMSLPFQHGFAPEWWTRVKDIMLEKEEGNSRCHRLCIIALFESDFNQAKCILIGCRLTHHLAETKMISDMQYGSVPGKQCISTVLKKVFSHDHIRLTKSTASFIENDSRISRPHNYCCKILLSVQNHCDSHYRGICR